MREELLRPSHYLGYDRDDLGCYFLAREAFELAESQFRRAVYVNPFEPTFKVHWALSLIKLNRMAEARSMLLEVLGNRQDDPLARQIWHDRWPREAPVPDEGPPQARGTPDQSEDSGNP